MKPILILGLGIFIVMIVSSLVSAEVSVTLGKIINYGGNSNSSEYWDGLNTINLTQMENNVGVLNIHEAWLLTLVSGVGDNSSWNETYADTLYLPHTTIWDTIFNNTGNDRWLDGGNPFDQSLNITDNVVFNTMNTSTIFESGGKVGIGTTNPTGKITVNVGTDQNLKVSSDSSTLRLSTVNDADSAFVDMMFKANEFEFMNGNVGIGTTAPNALLSVLKTTFDGQTGITFGHSTDYHNGFYANFGGAAVGNSMRFIVNSGYQSRGTVMTLLGNGNVGIGTTTPSQMLDVRGIGNFSGTVYINNGTDVSTLGSGNSSWNETYADTLYLNVNETLGDLNVSGNITGNLIYGEMWMNNQSSSGRTTVINTLGVWENVTGFDQTGNNGGQMLNGVTFTNNNALNVNVDGLYKVDYSMSIERASGGVSREFEIGLRTNGIIQNKTKVHRTTSNVNDAGSLAHTGFLRLNSTSNLHLMIRNMGGTEDVGTHSADLNIVRIGD